MWSSSVIALKVALDYIPPLLLLGLRNLISGTVLFLPMLLGHAGKTRKVWKYLIPIALLFAMDQIFFISGLKLITVGESAVLFHTFPFMVVALSYLIIGEVINSTKILGVVLGFSGVALFFLGDLYGLSFNLLGYIFTLLGALTWALNLILTKKWARNVDSRLLATLNLLIASSLMLAMSSGVETIIPSDILRGEVVVPLLYAAVGNIFALTAWFKLTKHWEPTKMATYAFLVPLLAVIFAWTLLDQALGLVHIAAMAMIFTGIALVSGGFRLIHRSRKIRRRGMQS